ncbi:hypothetical protein LPJ57_004636, partial [Coemansia sp. RSA 486]
PTSSSSSSSSESGSDSSPEAEAAAAAAPARREIPAEPYPWKRVTLGVFLVFLCWTIGLYRENKDRADHHLRKLQHWGFNHLWSHLSPGSSERLHPLRQPLWNRVHGTVLEIGPGFGESLALVPGGRKGTKVVSKYVVLEPNHFMHDRLATNAAAAGFSVRFDPNTCPEAVDGEQQTLLPPLVIVNGTLDSSDRIPTTVVESGPYDCVISSMVLCSVDDPEQNLENIQKLLKPGGLFVFVEHVRHKDVGIWRRIQDLITPVWALFTGNCRLDRETGNILDTMGGWASVDYRRVSQQQSGVIDKLTPIIYGVATKK